MKIDRNEYFLNILEPLYNVQKSAYTFSTWSYQGNHLSLLNWAGNFIKDSDLNSGGVLENNICELNIDMVVLI